MCSCSSRVKKSRTGCTTHHEGALGILCGCGGVTAWKHQAEMDQPLTTKVLSPTPSAQANFTSGLGELSSVSSRRNHAINLVRSCSCQPWWEGKERRGGGKADLVLTLSKSLGRASWLWGSH